MKKCYISKKNLAMSPAHWLIFGVCILVFTTGAASSLPTDCSVVGWNVPKPPDGAKLLQVQAVIRCVACEY